MLTIQSKYDLTLSYPLELPYQLEDIIFFDIETTGFSVKTSFLYLIGCMYYKDNSWQMLQWLADDMNSELALLKAFFQKIKEFKRIVHFNGSGFDIPFLLKKCEQHQLNESFEGIESFDIYKKLLPYKKMLPLANFKLKTIENFLNIKREDIYSGEELIQVYANYLGRMQYERLQKKMLENPNYLQNKDSKVEFTFNNKTSGVAPTADDLSHILLLHNTEDVKGLLQVSNILYYTNIFESILNESSTVPNPSLYFNPKSEGNETGFIMYTLPYSIPKPISLCTLLPCALADSNHESKYAKLSITENKFCIEFPLFQGELKYFYPNYKDYFYLPKEDEALHKSVAQYVDKEYRIQAKAFNCYSKKTSTFLPQPEELISPSFKREYRDKLFFFEESNVLMQQPENLFKYLKSWVTFITTSKETKIPE